jgi:uncharacterized protein with WD repeat
MKKIRLILYSALAVLLTAAIAISPVYAANALTSVTGVVTGTTVATFNVRGNQGAVQIFLKYGKGDGTSVAVSTIEFIVPQLGGTTLYQVPASSTSGTTLGSYTLTLNADGNYIITIGYVPREATSMKITVAFTGGTTQTLQVDAKVDSN